MQAVRSGIRALARRSLIHSRKCTASDLPKYFASLNSQEFNNRNVHVQSWVRGFLGRREYTQVAYSPATYLDKQEVTDRVIQVFKSCPQVDPSKVGPTAHFEKDLSLDILDTVEIMMEMEEEFAIDIPNSEADKMASCADVIKYIAAHPQAK
ncbi:hypothetical protein SUGI_0433200 [Cryptomeria japonica]|uniref:acyl carrier protein 1, mitochondrial n=1 Tax=Cryptomeria japonica TaxID=3369 RepID=UPI002408B436|nr:acyl carrier protein 1, mitochondrial [Cryptomeria japonica]GLJ22962.1 hypothetical protein SUGI_0433200 [Cryptomeria japonica]